MYRELQAEIKDVDLILDFKLDIIFNSKEIASMERCDLEKIVNYCEEEIRENIDKYKLWYDDENIVAAFSVDDYSDEKMIDFIYVTYENRRNGIGKKILNNIINKNYQVLYAWVDKENEAAICMFKNNNFVIDEETDFKYLMKNLNEKEENKSIKQRMFEDEVAKLAKKYGIRYNLRIE
ncbi:MAG: GNAT family N-acetyltransferase [Clostridia bacterium]|nr:GNAT family N-acetyltransferase [Clostridia bacterium]